MQRRMQEFERNREAPNAPESPWEGNGQEENNGKGGRPRPPRPSQMRAFTETMKAENRAKIAEYMVDMHERMVERGIIPR